jgi:hypothetical protein
MLTDLPTLQLVPKLANGLSNDQLTQLLQGADRAIKSYCKQEFEQATYTEYHDGAGQPALVLRQGPVQSVTSVWMDSNGYYGQATGAFAANTLLIAGGDYALKIDDPGGTMSLSRLLRRIGGSGGASILLGFWKPGTLSQGRAGMVWPQGQGNVKVLYVGGYPTGHIPYDLVQACINLVAWTKANVLRGGLPLQSENLGKYGYTVAMQGLGAAPELGTTRQLLATYRDLVM